MTTPRDFYKEFSGITKFEIVGPAKESERQIRFVGRVRSRAVSRVWATQYVAALVHASNSRWSVDVSRYYFAKDGDVIWAWRIIIQVMGVPMESALDEILRALRISSRAAAVAPAEINEIPLIAASPTRNMVIKGKGASSIKERK